MAALLLTGCTVPSVTSNDGAPPVGSGQTAQSDGVVGEEARLVRIVDGDSIEVEVSGRTIDVRLMGYNAPELYGPSAGGVGDVKTCNGEAAKAELAELLGDGTILLVGDETDRFGRRLADILVDNGWARTEMIDRGWGLATGDDPADRERMKRAATEQRGLWGDGCGSPVETGLEIGPVQVDPPGWDRDNLNGEWVTVVNRAATSIDLDGWVIRDDTTGHRFELGGALEPDQTLTVRSGRGSDTTTERHLNETFPVWSNDGETVLLVDPTGVVAHWAFVD